MPRFLIRLLVNAIALYVAIRIVPGIQPQTTGWAAILALALIFGVINAFFGPLLRFLTCPLILLTLGLFTLLINTFLFWLSGRIGEIFGVGFTVDSFWSAFLGSLVVSVVSVALSTFLRDTWDARPSRRD
ncbi:MAG: phage holin family protein [Anaerolineales bacterium]|nr:phage holin family protein [Anaerolineales bacterium]MCS7248699.1 phage holin family protein [Anaerolineales bacterium]MDW8162512.1 phage holin family protein [Anaerolineales bacterium]MDW8445693.1 phage holin family protein [Anaerolineales bacterium]